MLAGRVDVRREPVDRGVVVRQELDRVSAERPEVAERVDQGEHAFLGDLRAGRQVAIALDVTDELGHLALPPQAPGGKLDPADRGVEEKPGPGQEEDEQQPGPRRGGAPPLRHVHQHHEPDRPLAQDVEEGPGDVHVAGA